MARPMDLLNSRVTLPSIEAKARLDAELRERAAQDRYREAHSRPLTIDQHKNARQRIAYEKRRFGLGEAV